MRFCVINVGGFSYTALSPSTCEAVADAMQRFPEATRISARARLNAGLPGAAWTPDDAQCLAGRHARGEKKVYARFPLAGDASGDSAWGKGLAYCGESLH